MNPQTTSSEDQNEDSVVLLVEYGDSRLMFTGDIGSTTENTILGLGASVTATVLKVAHHGSRYSSSATFLDAVGADYAIVTVGTNTYGHPAQETLDRLSAAGMQILRTDEEGTIVIACDGHICWHEQPDKFIFVPLAMRSWTPPPDITCWVSNSSPSRYSNVTVYGKLEQDGVGIVGVPMSAEWRYKTTTNHCDGMSGSDGVASCTRYIGAAASGYTVNIQVTMTHSDQDYLCITSFTPQ